MGLCILPWMLLTLVAGCTIDAPPAPSPAHTLRTRAEDGGAAPAPPADPSQPRAEVRKNHYPDGQVKTEWVVVVQAEKLPYRHGSFTRFHPNGRTAMRGHYSNGAQSGVWSWYDDQGRLQRRVRMHGDYEEVISGRWLDTPNTVFFSIEGIRLAEGIIKQNRPHGPWKFFYKFGGLRAEGHYKAGLLDGRWRYFFHNGQVERLEEYRLGMLDGQYMRGYANGQEAVQGQMSLGVRTGLWRTWYENGQMESEGKFAEDQPEGDWRFWDLQGTLLRHLEYAGGIVTGERTPAATPQPDPVIPIPETMPLRPVLFDDAGQPIEFQPFVESPGAAAPPSPESPAAKQPR